MISYIQSMNRRSAWNQEKTSSL